MYYFYTRIKIIAKLVEVVYPPMLYPIKLDKY